MRHNFGFRMVVVFSLLVTFASFGLGGLVNIEITPSTGTVGEPMTFSAITRSEITYYSWYFEGADRPSISGEDVSTVEWVFSTPGDHSLLLQVQTPSRMEVMSKGFQVVDNVERTPEPVLFVEQNPTLLSRVDVSSILQEFRSKYVDSSYALKAGDSIVIILMDSGVLGGEAYASFLDSRLASYFSDDSFFGVVVAYDVTSGDISVLSKHSVFADGDALLSLARSALSGEGGLKARLFVLFDRLARKFTGGSCGMTASPMVREETACEGGKRTFIVTEYQVDEGTCSEASTSRSVTEDDKSCVDSCSLEAEPEKRTEGECDNGMRAVIYEGKEVDGVSCTLVPTRREAREPDEACRATCPLTEPGVFSEIGHATSELEIEKVSSGRSELSLFVSCVSGAGRTRRDYGEAMLPLAERVRSLLPDVDVSVPDSKNLCRAQPPRDAGSDTGRQRFALGLRLTAYAEIFVVPGGRLGDALLNELGGLGYQLKFLSCDKDVVLQRQKLAQKYLCEAQGDRAFVLVPSFISNEAIAEGIASAVNSVRLPERTEAESVSVQGEGEYGFDLLISRARGYVGDEIFFSINEQAPSEVPITSYVWDYGDGVSGETTEGMSSHVYSEPGRYFVTVQVVGDQGNRQRIGCRDGNPLYRVERRIVDWEFCEVRTESVEEVDKTENCVCDGTVPPPEEKELDCTGGILTYEETTYSYAEDCRLVSEERILKKEDSRCGSCGNFEAFREEPEVDVGCTCDKREYEKKTYTYDEATCTEVEKTTTRYEEDSTCPRDDGCGREFDITGLVVSFPNVLSTTDIQALYSAYYPEFSVSELGRFSARFAFQVRLRPGEDYRDVDLVKEGLVELRLFRRGSLPSTQEEVSIPFTIDRLDTGAPVRNSFPSRYVAYFDLLVGDPNDPGKLIPVVGPGEYVLVLYSRPTRFDRFERIGGFGRVIWSEFTVTTERFFDPARLDGSCDTVVSGGGRKLVFYGLGFRTPEVFDAYVRSMLEERDGLFSVSPFKEYSDEFTVVRSSASGIPFELRRSIMDSKVYVCDNSDERWQSGVVRDLRILVGPGFRSSHARFGRSVRLYTKFERSGVASRTTQLTLAHEMGHAFGLLADEYAWSELGNWPRPPNCASTEAEASSWWGDLVGRGSGVLEVGYYDGCSYISSNVRPTENSMMRFPENILDEEMERAFGPVNERALCAIFGGRKGICSEY